MSVKERGVLLGSLAAGLLASACCIGPLVLGVLGLGSLGLGAALAPLRPWFLAATAVLLAVGFYLAYRPLPAPGCVPGEACAIPASRRTQRVTLWIVTALAVGLAAYPAGAARLAAARRSAAVVPAGGAEVVLDVQGMTCSGCAAEVEHELRQVRGVVAAEVSFERKQARVRLSSPSPAAGALVEAVEKAGYRATAASR